jgi:hypothetical protein
MKKIIFLMVFLALCELVMGTEGPTSESFAEYLGTNVSVEVCNSTIVQGLLINETEGYIIIDDLCTPKVGNVFINKKCVVMLYQGCDCIR